MLKIRSSQITVLSEQKRERTIITLANDLNEILPEFCEEFESRANLQSWVRTNFTNAEEYGFTTEEMIYRYLCVALMQGQGFDTNPWAEKIIKSSWKPITKIGMLEHENIEQLKQQESALMEKIADADDQILEQFIERKSDYVFSIGNTLFQLQLDSLDRVHQWIKSTGQRALDHGLFENIELDMWLDLSMKHGDKFYLSSWAQPQIEANKEPDQLLLSLLDNQPQ
ncbi:Uncharacterised protein [BD1-7 clade bacterium]|uniref:Uncharacterized protein n=1 Tax=BD1-7 clade bacterium TaxID=2029982 RepID=A0A5S9PIY8_9GAMM|nr:Uncharacterised protein [BD1-7 clade bacterium]